VFVPVATQPDWLQTFAKISPVTVTADAARSFALYGTPASLGAAVAWIGGLLIVFILCPYGATGGSANVLCQPDLRHLQALTCGASSSWRHRRRDLPVSPEACSPAPRGYP
jgi:hypothetical protein